VRLIRLIGTIGICPGREQKLDYLDRVRKIAVLRACRRFQERELDEFRGATPDLIRILAVDDHPVFRAGSLHSLSFSRT
jgi:hypothetical protein